MSAVLALSGGEHDIATARALVRDLARLSPGEWDADALDQLTTELLRVGLADDADATELRVSVSPGRLRVQLHARSPLVPAARQPLDVVGAALDRADDWGAYSVHAGDSTERVCWFELQAAPPVSVQLPADRTVDTPSR